jgi:DNA-directed RNA polymerase specialized sigma24 family protein
LGTFWSENRERSSLALESVRRADRLARRMRAAEAGDQRAVRAILGLVAPSVSRVVNYVLGPDHPDAGDLVQDSLMEFLRSMPAPADDVDLPPFAAAIALRRALEASQWPALSQTLASPLPGRWFDRLLGISPQEVLRLRRRRLVATALIALSDEEAEVLGLRLLVGLSLPAIADMTGMPAALVRARLRSAKSVLGTAAALDAGETPLHPEALRDQELEGGLAAPERARLLEHAGDCVACTIEREVAADLARARVSPRAAVRLGRAIDAATAHWVWNVSRRVLVSRRQRRWAWAALGAVITLLALLAGAAWSRHHAVPVDNSFGDFDSNADF